MYTRKFLLLDNFEYNQEKSICSLDLGGGSTQITFLPTNQVNFLFKNLHRKNNGFLNTKILDHF